MLPEARDNRVSDNRVSYDLTMPSPPRPKRRGPLEFYEWIALIIFLMVFGAAIATHIQLEAGSTPSVREGTNTLTYIDAVAAFFFLLLVVFDTLASRRYLKHRCTIIHYPLHLLRQCGEHHEDAPRTAGHGERGGHLA